MIGFVGSFVQSVMDAIRKRPGLLCVPIVVTAVIAVLGDLESEKVVLHLTDLADVLMVVLVAIYLRNTEGDQLRGVLNGLLYGVVMLMIVMYCTLG